MNDPKQNQEPKQNQDPKPTGIPAEPSSPRPRAPAAETALELRLKDDLKVAMKAREADRVGLIRLVLSELKYARIEHGGELTADDVLAVLKRGVKTRSESIEQFRRGGREDLARHEEREVELLRTYLPSQLTGDALAAVVDEAIRKAGAATAKDMGAVMKLVLGEHGPRVDGKEVQALVKSRLTG
jgi:uncharacterized protein YqeY